MDDAIKCECCDGRGWHPPPGKTADQVREERRSTPRRAAARDRLDARIRQMEAEGRLPRFGTLAPVPDEQT